MTPRKSRQRKHDQEGRSLSESFAPNDQEQFLMTLNLDASPTRNSPGSFKLAKSQLESVKNTSILPNGRQLHLPDEENRLKRKSQIILSNSTVELEDGKSLKKKRKRDRIGLAIDATGDQDLASPEKLSSIIKKKSGLNEKAQTLESQLSNESEKTSGKNSTHDSPRKKKKRTSNIDHSSSSQTQDQMQLSLTQGKDKKREDGKLNSKTSRWSQEDNEMGAAERRTESSTQKSDQEQESPGSPRKKKKKKKDYPQASKSQESNLFDGDDISNSQETPLKKKKKKSRKNGEADIQNEVEPKSLSIPNVDFKEAKRSKKKAAADVLVSTSSLEPIPQCSDQKTQENSPIKKKKKKRASDCTVENSLVDSTSADPLIQDEVERESKKNKKSKGKISTDLQSRPSLPSIPLENGQENSPRKRKKQPSDCDSVITLEEFSNATAVQEFEVNKNNLKVSSKKKSKKISVSNKSIKSREFVSTDDDSTDDALENVQEHSPRKKKKQLSDCDSLIMLDQSPKATALQEIKAIKNSRKPSPRKKQREKDKIDMEAFEKSIFSNPNESDVSSCIEIPNGSVQGEVPGIDDLGELDVFEMLKSGCYAELEEDDEIPDFHPEIRKIQILSKKQINEKVENLLIIEDFPVHEEHLVEEGIFKLLSLKYRTEFSLLEMKTPGSRWTSNEDKILLRNWDKFKKIYKLEDENDWQCFEVNEIMPVTYLLTFYRFLGQGLPKRTLQSIHRRFIHLKKHGSRKKKVPFSPAEDAYILRFMRVYQKRDVYARLGSILGRDRRCLRVHCEKLIKAPKSKGVFTEIATRFKSISHENLTKVLQAIMKCVNCSTVKELQQVKKIPWQKVAKKVDLTDNQVYRLWVSLFYSAIRLERKECYYPILLQIIEEIEMRKCKSISEVPWKRIAKNMVYYHQVFLRELLQRFIYRFQDTSCDFKHSLQLVKLRATELNQKETFYKNEFTYPLRFTEDGTVMGLNTS